MTNVVDTVEKCPHGVMSGIIQYFLPAKNAKKDMGMMFMNIFHLILNQSLRKSSKKTTQVRATEIHVKWLFQREEMETDMQQL